MHRLRAAAPGSVVELPWADISAVRVHDRAIVVETAERSVTWSAPDADPNDLAQVAEWLDATRARGLLPAEVAEPPPELQQLRAQAPLNCTSSKTSVGARSEL